MVEFSRKPWLQEEQVRSHRIQEHKPQEYRNYKNLKSDNFIYYRVCQELWPS